MPDIQDPLEESFQAYLAALAKMQKGFLRELFRIIQAGYQEADKEGTIESLVSPLVSLVRDYRKRAHGYTANFLMEQAEINGAGQPVIAPDAVGYSETAVRTVLHSKMRVNAMETWVATAGTFARAVNNVTRETVIASSEMTAAQHPAAFKEIQIEDLDTLADELGEENFSASDAWDDLVLQADEAEARKKLDELRPDDADSRTEWDGIESREGVYKKILTGDYDDQGNPRKPFAWARVLVGAQNCHFCIMLAARGPAYATKDSALFRKSKGKKNANSPISRLRNEIDRARSAKGKQRFHDFCDCEVVPVFNRESWPGKQQYEATRQMWEAAQDEADRHNTEAIATARLKSELTGKKVKPDTTDTVTVLKRYAGTFKHRGWSLDFDPLKPENPQDDGWEMKNWQWRPPATGDPITRSNLIRHRLTDSDKKHIWNGEADKRKGGHHPGANRPNKTEFPANWSKNEALHNVQRTIDSPDIVHTSGDAVEHYKLIDGVVLKAKFRETSEGSEFITAFPDRGRGVYANLLDTGIKLRAPLVTPGEYKNGTWHEIV